jgi:hypothetical protein
VQLADRLHERVTIPQVVQNAGATA